MCLQRMENSIQPNPQKCAHPHFRKTINNNPSHAIIKYSAYRGHHSFIHFYHLNIPQTAVLKTATFQNPTVHPYFNKLPSLYCTHFPKICPLSKTFPVIQNFTFICRTNLNESLFLFSCLIAALFGIEVRDSRPRRLFSLSLESSRLKSEP